MALSIADMSVPAHATAVLPMVMERATTSMSSMINNLRFIFSSFKFKTIIFVWVMLQAVAECPACSGYIVCKSELESAAT